MQTVALFEARPVVQEFYRVIDGTIERGLSKSGPEGRLTDGFIYVLDGKAHYELEGYELERYTLDAKPGDFIFLSKRTVYAMTVKSECYRVIIVNFDFSFTDSIRLRSVISPIDSDKKSEKLFTKILSVWQIQGTTVKEECLSILYSLYANLLNSIGVHYHSSLSCQRMNEALLYINKHLAEESLSIPEIAAHFQLSESHFRRTFKEIYHISPGEYIIAQRINFAKDRIRYSTDTITSISESMGFSSVFHFSHAFKKEVGYSPIQYRKYCNQFPKT